MSKDVTEDFWNDCYNMRESKETPELLPNKIFNHYYGRNNYNNKKFKNNHNYSNLSYENKNRKKKDNSKNKTHNKTIENNNLIKIYKNHRFLEENIENNKIDKELQLKKKNAMMRCLGLYAYGVEVKKAKLLNDENNKKEKIQDEMSQCTFKPKIGKYSKNKQAKFNSDWNYNKNKNQNQNNNINSNGDYKINNLNANSIENGVANNNIKNKNSNNDDEDSNNLEECTFKPKINKKNIKKVFDKSKSLAHEKDNAQFILRYTKAREDYMIKKLKKLSTKDDSYDTTMLTLADKLNNKQYRNGSNDIIDTKNHSNKKKVYLSMKDYKEYLVDKKKINLSNNIINNLRNDLLDINLNEEE